jgi:hypothetical protein
VLAAVSDGRQPPALGENGGRACPRCSARSLHRREGCWVCTSCGYSKCN